MAYASTIPPVREREPRTGGGGPRPPRTFDRGGGGGGGRGDGWHDDRLRRARLSMVIVVVAVGMLFTSLAAVYLLRQNALVLDAETGQAIRKWQPIVLPLKLLLINTAILLLSSMTLEICRRKLRREAASGWNAADNYHYSSVWLSATVVLGFGFLDGQWMAWRALERRGTFLYPDAASSFFYLLTGTHAVHLLGGLIALVVASVMAVLHRGLKQRRIMVEVTAMYWHFMAFLWLCLLALMYFAP